VETERALQELGTELQETRQARDRAEKELDSLKTRRQELIWQAEKLQSSQQERRQLVAELQERIRETEPPYPLAETPEEEIEIEKIEEETQQLQKKISALEPVNMLAMEEYEKTRERLDELGDKLTTLEAERTELLLRIENFTTLRLNAFSDAFNKVNENFKNTFSELSEGDGHLQLENEEDPFSGGLNLIAHPKGKPVQRLSSMSGGEKSLTALSFIFSLQRYRPSPFYAFDEVDMFLDGANVEKLARMIREQARQAQFIVVSLRRPMIESSERTIGVTQARGTHTQVLGIKV
jgi:chromosome segregation protein